MEAPQTLESWANMAKNAGEWFKKVENGEIENPYVFEHSNEPRLVQRILIFPFAIKASMLGIGAFCEIRRLFMKLSILRDDFSVCKLPEGERMPQETWCFTGVTQQRTLLGLPHRNGAGAYPCQGRRMARLLCRRGDSGTLA